MKESHSKQTGAYRGMTQELCNLAIFFQGFCGQHFEQHCFKSSATAVLRRCLLGYVAVPRFQSKRDPCSLQPGADGYQFIHHTPLSCNLRAQITRFRPYLAVTRMSKLHGSVPI